jgi:hypothetical protein
MMPEAAPAAAGGVVLAPPGIEMVGGVGVVAGGEVRGNWIVPWPNAEVQRISPKLDNVHRPR